MTIAKRSFVLFAVLLAASKVLPAQSDPNLTSSGSDHPLQPVSSRTGLLLKDRVTHALIQNSSGDLAHNYVSQFALWDRTRATPGFRAAAEWVAAQAKSFGLEQVRLEHFLADGRTRYFGVTPGPAWRVKHAELWLAAPDNIRLTTYSELPMSLARNSTSANVEAELVDVGVGLAESDYQQNVRGKVVLSSSDPAVIFEKAVRQHGAAGIISYWTVPTVIDSPNRQPGEFVDQVGWAGLPVADAGAPQGFAFMISPRRAGELKRLLDKSSSPMCSHWVVDAMGCPGPAHEPPTKVMVRAVVDAELTAGTLDVVSAVIPGGKYPNEEILVTAHLDHYKPGASDNASGSASVLEMARTLRSLIDAKVISPPLRTVRFLWVPEYEGTYAWLATHLKDPAKIMVDLNFDMLGENLSTTNAIFNMFYTPDSVPSYLNAVTESILDFMNLHNDERYPSEQEFQILSVTGSRNRLQGRMHPFIFGTDFEVFGNLGIPATDVTSWPDNFYHSSEDTPDKVDPTQLHRVVFAGLAEIVTTAYADDENVADLAALALVFGRKRAAQNEEKALRMVAGAQGKIGLDTARWARNLLRHAYRREGAAIRSVSAYARTAETRARVEDLASSFEKNLDTDRTLEALMGSRRLAIEKREPSLTNTEQQAARIVPSRVPGKELLGTAVVFSQPGADDGIDVQFVTDAFRQAAQRLRAVGKSDLVVLALNDAPAYYADGRRSVLQIREEMAAEYTLIPIEALVEYFRAFEKAGVMALIKN
jgi:hypothetical protein